MKLKKNYLEGFQSRTELMADTEIGQWRLSTPRNTKERKRRRKLGGKEGRKQRGDGIDGRGCAMASRVIATCR